MEKNKRARAQRTHKSRSMSLEQSCELNIGKRTLKSGHISAIWVTSLLLKWNISSFKDSMLVTLGLLLIANVNLVKGIEIT